MFIQRGKSDQSRGQKAHTCHLRLILIYYHVRAFCISHYCHVLLDKVLMWSHSFENGSTMCCCCFCFHFNHWSLTHTHMPDRSPDKRPACTGLCASCCLSYGAGSTGFLLAGSPSSLGGFGGKYWSFHAVLTTDVAIIQVPHFLLLNQYRTKKWLENCGAAPKRNCLEVLLSSSPLK